VSDLGDQLTADGLERRVQVVARSITKKEHAYEVLRIAALLAQASDDVSALERDVLSRIAKACNVEPGEVDVALTEARKVLASG
jgi:tellurite resistance protein